jgi:hypothetical protein
LPSGPTTCSGIDAAGAVELFVAVAVVAAFDADAGGVAVSHPRRPTARHRTSSEARMVNR